MSSFSYEDMDPEVSEHDRLSLLAFLKELKPVHKLKLKEFARNQPFTDNQLSRIKAGAPVRISLFRAVKSCAAERGLTFPDNVHRKPLEMLIMQGMDLSIPGLQDTAETWGGEYLMFTKAPAEMVRVAELSIAREPNGYGFPYFRIWRREGADALLIRGHCIEIKGVLYLVGHSSDPAYPRLVVLNGRQVGNDTLLIGTVSTSTATSWAFIGPCAAIRLGGGDKSATIAPGAHHVTDVEKAYPAVATHLASFEPIGFPRQTNDL